METEVRFSINKKNKKSVQKWLSQHKQIFQNSETVYFDTSKNALRDAGVELRLRRNGKGIKQTIKSVGPNGSLFTRTESEIQLSDFEPKLSHLKKFLTREKLCRIDFARLRPAFRTKVNRTIINNPTKNGMVQSVFDVGEIKADAETQEIMEVEHELKQGSTDTLLETCHEFLDRVPCSIGLEGKAARGYRLVTGEYPEPVFASKISISPDLPLPKAMREILQTSFQHAMTNLPVYLLTGHPESVHQFRVGLRRLRAALSAFAPILHLQNSGGLILQMKSIFNDFGSLRDADVFLDETLAALKNSTIPSSYYLILQEQVQQFRDQRFQEARDTLESTDFARFIIDMNSWIDSEEWLAQRRPIDQLMFERPIGVFAESRIQKMNQKLLKAGRRAEVGDLEDWHRLRIMTKKVRYASEPLLGIIGGKKGPSFAKSLSKLQDTLGKLNDLNSIETFLAQVSLNVERTDRQAFNEAAAFCVGWGAASASTAVDNLQPSWRKFKMHMRKTWS
ncbi:MAG: hypothetical protein CMM19_10245 [Rhodospirillaceae bacterium]|jgi:inorganic triphosphatase YgiF|nr:hypothetical protein [Rhodospirillaceae bacterium]|tara:strand:- start:7014 stop:8534 length:1521 start_codon:yes stop_codon:yes gene_type:complete